MGCVTMRRKLFNKTEYTPVHYSEWSGIDEVSEVGTSELVERLVWVHCGRNSPDQSAVY
jgi:hypothetical protein